MLICGVGDTHGAIDRMYDEILAFEVSIGVRFDAVLHVGDFGIWPDPNRIDKATKKHDGAGDFATWCAERRRAPRKTIFVKGNHEDFDWLDAQPGNEILPDLYYLRNGQTTHIGEGRDVVRVGGIGGCYAPSDYKRQSKQLRGGDKAHYTHDEIAALGADVDVLLLHDAPAGVRFAAGHESVAEGLCELIQRVRPIVCLFGHHHERLDAEIRGTEACIGLNLIGRPGNLAAFELTRGALHRLGER